MTGDRKSQWRRSGQRRGLRRDLQVMIEHLQDLAAPFFGASQQPRFPSGAGAFLRPVGGLGLVVPEVPERVGYRAAVTCRVAPRQAGG